MDFSSNSDFINSMELSNDFYEYNMINLSNNISVNKGNNMS